jgi:hypothetical protein
MQVVVSARSELGKQQQAHARIASRLLPAAVLCIAAFLQLSLSANSETHTDCSTATQNLQPAHTP